jgi:hypothetical protein
MTVGCRRRSSVCPSQAQERLRFMTLATSIRPRKERSGNRHTLLISLNVTELSVLVKRHAPGLPVGFPGGLLWPMRKVLCLDQPYQYHALAIQKDRHPSHLAGAPSKIAQTNSIQKRHWRHRPGLIFRAHFNPTRTVKPNLGCWLAGQEKFKTICLRPTPAIPILDKDASLRVSGTTAT